MDRSKPSANHKDIICGDAFEPTEILEELARIRHIPVDIIRNKQEDAHELLCQLLNEIHDEICLILYQSSANKNGTTIDGSIELYFFFLFRRINIQFRFIRFNCRFTVE